MMTYSKSIFMICAFATTVPLALAATDDGQEIFLFFGNYSDSESPPDNVKDHKPIALVLKKYTEKRFTKIMNFTYRSSHSNNVNGECSFDIHVFGDKKGPIKFENEPTATFENNNKSPYDISYDEETRRLCITSVTCGLFRQYKHLYIDMAKDVDDKHYKWHNPIPFVEKLYNSQSVHGTADAFWSAIVGCGITKDELKYSMYKELDLTDFKMEQLFPIQDFMNIKNRKKKSVKRDEMTFGGGGAKRAFKTHLFIRGLQSDWAIPEPQKVHRAKRVCSPQLPYRCKSEQKSNSSDSMDSSDFEESSESESEQEGSALAHVRSCRKHRCEEIIDRSNLPGLPEPVQAKALRRKSRDTAEQQRQSTGSEESELSDPPTPKENTPFQTFDKKL